jgi:hypothetical protein
MYISDKKAQTTQKKRGQATLPDLFALSLSVYPANVGKETGQGGGKPPLLTCSLFRYLFIQRM